MEGEERMCRMCYEERKIIKHMWNGCELREGKKRGELKNEDGREIGKGGKGYRRKGFGARITTMKLCCYLETN
jgi:hypothetical protein